MDKGGIQILSLNFSSDNIDHKSIKCLIELLESDKCDSLESLDLSSNI